MTCQDGHNAISKNSPFYRDGYGYCLICRCYRKLIPETIGDERQLRQLQENKKGG